MNEFEKYATRHCGINSLKLHDFRSQYAAYVYNPQIQMFDGF